jgi:hypothetical protein
MSSRAKEEKSLIKKTFGLAACGVVIALAAAGCSSGSSGSSTTAGKGTGPASPAAAASPKATDPAWAKTLGPGVTVTGPSTAKAGDGSPAGVFLSAIKAAQAGSASQMCALYEPSLQAKCMSETGSMSVADFKSGMPTVNDRVPSYTAIDGDLALLGSTGKVCQAGSCFTNNDPAALFDSGRSFRSLWLVPTNGSNSDQVAYALGRFIRVNGTWYNYAASM